MHDPWLITFRLLDEPRTRHCYVIKDDVDAATARQLAWQKAETDSEKAARHGAPIDPGHVDVLELTEFVRSNTLRLT